MDAAHEYEEAELDRLAYFQFLTTIKKVKSTVQTMPRITFYYSTYEFEGYVLFLPIPCSCIIRFQLPIFNRAVSAFHGTSL